MADDGEKADGPFDVARIKSLVALMQRHDLSEIDLHDGDRRIRLRRGFPSAAPAAVPVAPAVPAAAPAARAGEPAPAAPAKKLVEIKAPTPGTFYAKPSPDAETFVRVGGRVSNTTVVCLIEAMKLFNEIQADCSGVIAEILVENQQAVEYNQVLFRVDPTA